MSGAINTEPCQIQSWQLALKTWQQRLQAWTKIRALTRLPSTNKRRALCSPSNRRQKRNKLTAVIKSISSLQTPHSGRKRNSKQVTRCGGPTMLAFMSSRKSHYLRRALGSALSAVRRGLAVWMVHLRQLIFNYRIESRCKITEIQWTVSSSGRPLHLMSS